MNLCIFFSKKPGQISLSLPGLKQPLWWSEHTAPCVAQPPSSWFGWVPGKGHTTEKEPHSILRPAFTQPACMPDLTASRPPRYTDKLGFSLQGPISIPRWCQQVTAIITFWVPSEQASYLLDFLCSSGLYLGISAKDMFCLDPLPWPLHISGKLS